MPEAQGNFQSAASLSQSSDLSMPVGTIITLPVMVDPNMPTNLGAGTNQAPIVVWRSSDVWLFEGTPRLRSLPEILSGFVRGAAGRMRPLSAGHRFHDGGMAGRAPMDEQHSGLGALRPG